MSQPDWEVVYSTDYSTLYRDKTGEYEAELEIREEIDDTSEEREDGVETIEVEYYRFPLDRLKWAVDSEDPGRRYLVPEAYEPSWRHPAHSYEEWFVERLSGVANSIGSGLEELIEALISDDIRARAWAYESIGGYFGYINLDGYPRRVREEI